MGKLHDWARTLERESLALYYATRDARTPWHAKLLAGAIVAYALSPIDLIPDFIPVLGLVDDLLLLPGAIWLALRLVPDEVMLDARERANAALDRPTSRTAAAVILAIWIACAALVAYWAARWF
jgi:uncharacterized membrane protein YkvA (DUF1232 family)